MADESITVLVWDKNKVLDEFHVQRAGDRLPSGEYELVLKPVDFVDDGMCRSCVNDKCVTGPECVTLGRDATPHGGVDAVQAASEYAEDYIDCDGDGTMVDNTRAAFLAGTAWRAARYAELLAGLHVKDHQAALAEIDALRAKARLETP